MKAYEFVKRNKKKKTLKRVEHACETCSNSMQRYLFEVCIYSLEKYNDGDEE